MDTNRKLLEIVRYLLGNDRNSSEKFGNHWKSIEINEIIGDRRKQYD